MWILLPSSTTHQTNYIFLELLSQIRACNYGEIFIIMIRYIHMYMYMYMYTFMHNTRHGNHD